MVYAVSEILFIQTCNRPKQGITHIWRQLFTIFLRLNFSKKCWEYVTKAYNFEVIGALTGESQIIHFSPLVTKVIADQ